MTKKQSTKKKKSVKEEPKTETPNQTSVSVSTPTQTTRKSLLPKDLFREIEELKRRVSELEKKVV